MHSHLPIIERARPLLGTTVSIRVHGLCAADAHRAIDEAFAEIALVHRLMSFQEPDSQISRLNREAHTRSQRVHPMTFEVLRRARDIAEASDGCFDITVAAKLVDWGLLPAPASDHAPEPEANWQHIKLHHNGRVRFSRRLWIDVSGIAKGYAVDRAIEKLRNHRAIQASVNAGGDLRIYGPNTERICLRPDFTASEEMAVLDVENSAVASSGATGESLPETALVCRPHVDPRNGTRIAADRFVSVVAGSCLVADALTKPVLILGEKSAALLDRYEATAHVNDSQRGWSHLSGGVQ